MKTHTVTRRGMALLLVLVVQAIAGGAQPSMVLAAPTPPGPSGVVFVVDSLGLSSDVVLDGVCLATNGRCTLTAAVAEANYLTGTPVTITFSVSEKLYVYSGFGFSNPAGVVLDGGTQGIVLINGLFNWGSPVMRVDTGASLTLRRIAISGVNQESLPDVPGMSAILNDGNLTLDQVTVSDNGMGGVWNQGFLTVNRSTISGNVGRDSGGGIYGHGTMTVVNSTISGNQTQRWGGGGIYHWGSLTLINSTVTGNSGGATGQHRGGGIFTGSGSGGTTVLKNSIVAGNTGGGAPDCDGTIRLVGPNLIGSSDGCTVDGQPPLSGPALLGPLGDHGGGMLTHLVGLASPAAQAGDAAVCAAAPVAGIDQRGIARPAGAPCTLGATEGGIPLSVLSIADLARPEGTGGMIPVRRTVTLTPAASSVVTVKATTVVGTAQPATPTVDYEPLNGATLTFAPGETSKPLVVSVFGDSVQESEETFGVRLSAQTGPATLGDMEATATIQNDDGGPLAGGRNLRLNVDAMRLTWDNGTLQTSYAVYRVDGTAGQGAVIAMLPGSAVAYQDAGALANHLLCYAVLSFSGPTPVGASDVLCARPGSGGAGYPAAGNLTVGLVPLATAHLTWDNRLPGLPQKLLMQTLNGGPLVTQVLGSGTAEAWPDTQGLPTCFAVGGLTLHTNVVCVIPNVSILRLEALSRELASLGW